MANHPCSANIFDEVSKITFIQLENALFSALAQFEELTGETFPIEATLDVVNDDTFWALAEVDDDLFRIRVSTGLVTTVFQLWQDAFSDDKFFQDIGAPVTEMTKELTHLSLVWLMLHEMEHYRYGHFNFIGRQYSTETDHAHSFSVASRTPVKLDRLADTPERDRAKIEPCLELQADHDAIELALDAYSSEEWEKIRHRAMAISGIIMLIDREDAKRSDKPSSHPKAATRIFQLLGHIMEMPMIQAQRKAILNGRGKIDRSDLPSNEEQSRFNQEVTIPAFFDAVNLARIAGAVSIHSDLGDSADFFGDVQIAKLKHRQAFDYFKTAGAREWADLVELNEILSHASNGNHSRTHS